MFSSIGKIKRAAIAGVSATALSIALAPAAVAQDAGADGDDRESRTLDTVTVTGIRGSLQRAIDVKRNADSVVDAISAEDIGKFPDQNLAESLQRITGVSISRARGEGSRVTVRGLGTGFNLTTLNGNTTTSASSDVNGNGGRDFAFDVLPAELVSGIEVYKSPTADLNEGSLGALVNIKTAKPFDSPGLQIAASVAGGYSTLPESWDPKLSGLISNTFANDTFGVLLAASYSERDIRQDSFIGNGHTFLSDALTTQIGLEAGAENPLALSQTNWGTLENQRERLGLAGAIQFQVTPDFELTFEGFYSDLEETGNAASLQMSPNAGGDNYSGTVQDGVLVAASGDTLAGATRLLVTNGNDNFVFPGNNTFENYSLSGEWNASDNLSVSGKAYYTKSESTYLFERYFANFSTNGFSYDQSRIGEMPSLTLPGVDLSDGAAYSIANFLGVDVVGQEEEQGAQLDFDYDVDLGAFTSLEFGVQRKERERFQDRDLYFSGTGDAPYPDGVPLIGVPSNFALSPSVFPSNFVYAGVDELRNALLPDGIAFSSDFDTFLYTVEEDVTAAYLKGNYEFDTQMPISGNVGIRLVGTEQTSSGLSQVLIGVDPDNPDLPLFSDDIQSISEKNKYTDLLWSANLKAELSDEMVMRLSGARVLARPPVSQLAPTLTSINLVNGTLGQGNPQLDPFRANQFDVTLEWYFDDVGSLTGGVFYKDVETLVVVQGELEEILPGVNLIVTQPRNIDGGAVYGFEVAYQNQFTSLPGLLNGLGVIANYTWVDSDINFENSFVDEGIGLVGNSEHNLNLVGFYEKAGFSARLAYNYRTEFLERTVGLAGNPEYVDAFGQLDAQASYDLNDNFTLFAEATDITEETLFRYSNNDERQIRALTNTGARYFVGVRYRY